MDRWEQRARKLEKRRHAMRVSGRSLLTAVRAAEIKRARRLGIAAPAPHHKPPAAR
ncbi:MAG: hypothetical protein HYX53_12555 [Chloroflexi bacterium]|nr:hypothetical protein [Chloroflexota bacterium]